jgi:fibronectin type 3 domain-containing protein
LSQAEYINILKWEANPDNEDIINYRVYLIEDNQKTLLTTLAADEFECRYRKVSKDKEYIYWIVAVNNKSREGDPAIVVVR